MCLLVYFKIVQPRLQIKNYCLNWTESTTSGLQIDTYFCNNHESVLNLAVQNVVFIHLCRICCTCNPEAVLNSMHKII